MQECCSDFQRYCLAFGRSHWGSDLDLDLKVDLRIDSDLELESHSEWGL